MNISFPLVSYSLALSAFLLLSLLLTLSWRGRPSGLPIIFAAYLSVFWAGVLTYDHFTAQEHPRLVLISEFFRDISWLYFLFITARKEPTKREHIVATSVIFALFTALLASTISEKNQQIIPPELQIISWMLIALVILGLVEHIFRYSTPEERWKIKYLCIGLGALFAYDFYIYADALLFKRHNETLFAARGIMNALAVPLIAISIARNPSYAITIHVSREVVFHSTTFIAAGVYLLAMSLMGYAIRFYGGNWGSVLQVVFFIGAGLLLVVLLFSGSIRGKIRVFLNKHFFSFKYDYRQKWLEFTQSLSTENQSVPESIVHAMASLVDSNGGLLYEKAGNQFRLLCSVNPSGTIAEKSGDFHSLGDFLSKTFWVIELPEFAAAPGRYPDLQLPTWLSYSKDYWLIVPLSYRKQLIGFLIINPSPIEKTINWEDRDLLKLAGQQAAVHLSQYQSDKELVNARQFEAFNKLSAYIVHDLKNILAQQSLIVANAEKHKTNPAFVDDVIDTIRNSVLRMTRLMEQMRNASRAAKSVEVDVSVLLRDVTNRLSAHTPRPHFDYHGPGIHTTADGEQLANVFSHLIQNAIEACTADGHIQIQLGKEDETVIITVTDNGIGMTPAFIRDRLFEPFDSTKGLTGMGIGAYESREYIRSLGGDIQVFSQVGQGSRFQISLPACKSDSTE